MISHQFVVAFQRVHVSNVPPHFLHPKSQVRSKTSAVQSEYLIRGPLQKSLYICVTALCSLTPSAHSQPSRHTHHSGAHLTQRLPHINTHRIHQRHKQHEGSPSKRTRSQYNSNCKNCVDHMAPHQTPFILLMQHLPLSAPADHPTLSCTSQSDTPKQKRRRLLQLNTNLKYPGLYTQPVDPTYVAHAIWNYKINKA